MRRESSVDERQSTLGERAEEEKSMVQPLWTDLTQTFPILKRLELHVPAEIYIGDDEMAELHPGDGWKLECART